MILICPVAGVPGSAARIPRGPDNLPILSIVPGLA